MSVREDQIPSSRWWKEGSNAQIYCLGSFHVQWYALCFNIHCHQLHTLTQPVFGRRHQPQVLDVHLLTQADIMLQTPVQSAKTTVGAKFPREIICFRHEVDVEFLIMN